MPTIKKFVFPFALAAFVAGGSFTAAAPAYAAGLTATQLQAITSLLASFGVDSSTIATVQATLSGTPAPASSTGTSDSSPSSGSNSSSGSATTTPGIGSRFPVCTVFNDDLSFGDSGESVTGLQQFLSDNGFYSGPVTGFFGSLTEKAIEALQSEHDIVATGTPRTTGFGAFGPLTRDFLKHWCDTRGNADTRGVVNPEAMTKVTIEHPERVASGTAITVSGSAENATVVSLSVTAGTTTAYQNASIPVADGAWTVTLPVLSDGAYVATVHAGGGRATAVSTFVVGTASRSVVSGGGTEVPEQSPAPTSGTYTPTGANTPFGTSSATGGTSTGAGSSGTTNASSGTGSAETTAPASITIRLNGSTGLVTIPSGGSVSVGWTAENASGCTIASQPASRLSGDIPTNAWAESPGPLTATTVFTITCTGENGTSVSKSATVNVAAPTPTSSGTGTGTSIGSGGLIHIACPQIAYQCPNGRWVTPSGPSCTYSCNTGL